MLPGPGGTQFIRFEPDCELDLRAYELRRSGRLLKLERIPMDILLLLIEHKDRLVTREEIAERIWGKGFALDIDNSINGAIRKIRLALKDDPERPQFVQTVTGRGYRFVAPLAKQETTHSVEKDDQTLRTFSMRASGVAHDYTGPEVAREAKSWPKRIGIALAFTFALMVATVSFYRRTYREIIPRRSSAAAASKITDRDILVLSDFVNTTGDPVFDEALKQALSMDLIQSPMLNVASDLQVREILRRMGRSPDEPLTQEVAAEVCSRVGGKAILAGTIANLGPRYVIGLEALGCTGGEMLGIAQVQADSKADVIKALDNAASQVRGKIGDSLPNLEKYNFPVDATTKSLAALKAFSMAQRALRDSGEGDAIPSLRHAIELDHDFALAYAVLGRAYENIGEDDDAMRNYTKAFQLRDRLSEREKYHITTLYYETVNGDLDQARTAAKQWTQTYPRDEYAREKLATVYADLGDIEQAHQQAQEALRLDPESTVNVFNSIAAADGVGRLDEARQILEAARFHGLDGISIRQSMYSSAFLRGDSAEMERQVAWTSGKGTAEELLLSQHSDTEAYYGRLRKAGELSKRAADAARRDGAKEIAATCEIVAALREIEVGNASSAHPSVRSALLQAPTRDVKILAALALAKTGDTAHAQALINELERKNPVNTLVKFYWIPSLKASVEIQVGHPQVAASLLVAAAPYELSATSNLTNMWIMYPVYVRGLAYLLAHNARAAAEEFNKILNHRGLVQNSILGALAQLQLARAEAVMGNKDGARRLYQDFLALWKDADPDIPVLKQAKAEYAKLQ